MKKPAVPEATPDRRRIEQDGEYFVGERNWQALNKVAYLAEPLTDQNYVTTGALDDLEYNLVEERPDQAVTLLDLEPTVRRRQMVVYGGRRSSSVARQVHGHREPSQKDGQCPLPSKRKTVILGKITLDELAERNHEEMHAVSDAHPRRRRASG